MRTRSRDPLTKLRSRASLQETLQQLEEPALLVVLDIDDFGAFNVRFGIRAGDECLRRMADDLADKLCPVELFRVGDDQFAFLITPAPREPAEHTIQLLISLTRPETYPGIRAGWAMVQASDSDVALGRAAAAVSASKTSASRTAGFTDVHVTALRRREAVSRALASALLPGQRQMHLAYQPIARLDDGALVAVEALARWQHPTLGVINPDEFVVLAEQTGQHCELDRWVIERALGEVPELEGQPLMHINVSALSLTTPGFTDVILDLVGQSTTSPDRVCIELTETALGSSGQRLRHAVETLHAAGLHISVDDFGTGHASWAYLNELPVDELKLDKSFIDDVAIEPQRAALIRAVVEVAQASGQSLVAEGVETAEQARALLALGCTLGQGYLLGRPQQHVSGLSKQAQRRISDAVPRPRPQPMQPTTEADLAQRITDLARQLSASTGTPAALLQVTLQALRNGIDFEGGSLQLVGPDGVRLAAAEPEPPPEALAARLPASQGVAGTVLSTGRLVYLPDITSSPAVPTRRRAISGGVRSYLAVPLFREGKAIGVLQIDSHHVNAFDAGARLTLSAAAAVVSAALDHTP